MRLGDVIHCVSVEFMLTNLYYGQMKYGTLIILKNSIIIHVKIFIILREHHTPFVYTKNLFS